MKDGPIKYFVDQMSQGALQLEAYWATVNQFAEAVYVGRGFAPFDGYYVATGLSSASGLGDFPITAPSAEPTDLEDDDDEETESLFEVRIIAFQLFSSHSHAFCSSRSLSRERGSLRSGWTAERVMTG